MSNVLITGVSSGIGHGLALHNLQRQQEVFGTSRRTPDDLTSNERFHFVSLDLQRTEDVEAALHTLLKDVRQLDLVILNAGVLGYFGDLRDTELDDLKNTMHVNVWANKLLLDALFDAGFNLRQVVAISSGASVNGNRGWSGYSVSKAALNMLIKLYAAERPETHFCALAPGLVDTAIQEDLCSRQADERYPAVETLRSKRHTAEMPAPAQAAPRLAETIDRLPETVASGEYADIRKLPE